jgi:membrane peptidoglycan carboxypeptidase
MHVPKDPVERAKVAAGFWSVDMSPVHGAILASVFARGGLLQPPHVLAQILGPGGEDLTPARAPSKRVVSDAVARDVADAMLETTTRGTASGSFRDERGNPAIPGMDVAGKTGSLTGRRAPFLNYNWFIGYAPANAPEVAFAVLLANEPKWKIKAHYAARRLVELWAGRRGEIARQRSVKITRDGLVAAVPQGSAASATSPGDGAPAPTQGAPAAQAQPALPPVPGPVAKAAGAGS